MAFALPVNTISDLRNQLNQLASAKGGMRYECRHEAKSNYDVIKAAQRGTCTWTQAIIACTVERADPNPASTIINPRSTIGPFPHRCGHVGVLVEAREGINAACFILDDTVLQWDLPVEASHQLPGARRGFWNDYFDNLHSHALSMNPPPSKAVGPPSSALHILAEGPDRNMAFNDWGRQIARHPFVISIGGMEVYSTALSDGMTP